MGFHKYGKKDAIIAICVVLFIIIPLGTPWVGDNLRPIQAILQFDWGGFSYWAWPIEKVLITIVPVIIIILARKQGFVSIGIHKENLLPAMGLGLMFSLIPMFWGLLPIVLYGGGFGGFGLFITLLATTFIMAVAEDIVFVGFLQTRLYGLFKSNMVAISVGAALFSFMHVPAWMIRGEISLDNFPNLALAIVFWFVMHFVLVAIFKRYNSIIPVAILHTSFNFFGNPNEFWVFAYEYRGYADDWALTTVPVVIVAVAIWVFVRHRRAKKML